MLYFKNSVKWIKDCFSLVGLVSFFAGVYSLALVDLFYFSEEITPTAFSAAFAGGALMLACYTAWKVNKWLNNKVNETAFKRSEELIQSISSFTVSLTNLIRVIRNINAAPSISEHGLELIKRDLGDSFNNYLEDANKFSILLEQLHVWGVEFKIKSEFYDVFMCLDKKDSPTQVNEILFLVSILMKNYNQNDEIIEDIKALSKTSIIGFQELSIELRKVMNRNHIELFSYN